MLSAEAHVLLLPPPDSLNLKTGPHVPFRVPEAPAPVARVTSKSRLFSGLTFFTVNVPPSTVNSTGRDSATSHVPSEQAE